MPHHVDALVVGINNDPQQVGKITNEGRLSLHAGISLNAAATATRGFDGGSDIDRVLKRQGMQRLNFAGIGRVADDRAPAPYKAQRDLPSYELFRFRRGAKSRNKSRGGS